MKTKEIEKRLKSEIRFAKNEIKKYEGKDAVIPYGKYKGRLGKIDLVNIDTDGNVRAVIRPYYLNDKSKLISWNETDARTYWKLDDSLIVEN